MLDGSEPAASEFAALWPVKRFPILTDDTGPDGDRLIVEATTIIEYLDLQYPGEVRFLPDDPDKALEVRMLDRFFDNYVMTPQGKIVFDFIRDSEHDERGVREARAMLDTCLRGSRPMDGRSRMGGGGAVQPRRPRRRAVAAVRRLEPPDPRTVRQRARLSQPPARAAGLRPRAR